MACHPFAAIRKNAAFDDDPADYYAEGCATPEVSREEVTFKRYCSSLGWVD
jgi:hypothetical protein